MKGSHPWLVILCVPSDRNIPAWPDLAYFKGLMSPGSGGLADYWAQVSCGAIDLTGTRVLGWYKVTKTLAEMDQMSRGSAAAVGRAAATKAGVDVSGYKNTLVFILGSGHYGAQAPDVAASVLETTGQPGWRWCKKCEGLAYWVGPDEPGHCPAGERHEHAPESYYAVPHNTAGPDGQAGWRHCSKCHGLVHADSGDAQCAGIGNHNTSASGEYFVRHGSTGANEQIGWRYCKSCYGLAYLDTGRGAGKCPATATGTHDHSTSGSYSVPFSFTAGNGGLAHETGHGFGFDHAFGPSRAGDLRDDPRPGAYGDNTDIMSWAKSASFASHRFTPSGPGMSAPTLIKMGWLSFDDVHRLAAGSGPTSVGIAPLYGESGHIRALQVVDAPASRIYTVSFRTATGWDRGVGQHRVVVHCQHTLYGAGQAGWSWCARCEGMIHNGTTQCPAGGAHDGAASGAYTLAHNAGAAAGQTNWRWCSKCCGLVFGGSGTVGRCPAGGDHNVQRSGDYALPSSGSGQTNWRWCKKCQGLTFGGNAMKGTCPSGGLHDLSGSGNYVIDSARGSNRQAGWRWCSKCHGMYFAGYVLCIGGEPHKLTGDVFSLPHNLAGAAGQPGWRWCSRCHGLAFDDGISAAGLCPAGGTHDHSRSGNYVIPIDAEASGGQTRWFFCGQCSSLHYVPSGGSAGRCTNNRTHAIGGEYIITHGTSAAPGARFRWCKRCSCMVLGDNPAGCAANGNHDTVGSGHYTVRTDPSTLSREQSYWRHCSQCSQVMFMSSADGSNEQPCPAGGNHRPTGEYFITLSNPVPYWRWCKNCEGLAYWDRSREPGLCPAGGRHDHSKGKHYAPPRRHDDAVQVLAEKLLAGDSYTVPGTSIQFTVTAIHDTHASVFALL